MDFYHSEDFDLHLHLLGEDQMQDLSCPDDIWPARNSGFANGK